jgi:DNA topoisomerase I
VDRDLCRQGIVRERVLAVALRMLDYGVFRTGNTEYAEDHCSRGAATLLRDDVCVRKGKLVFDFVAKGGVERVIELDDDRLVDAVSSLNAPDTASRTCWSTGIATGTTRSTRP